jgi:threonine dehydratase
METAEYAVTFADVQQAVERTAGLLRRTPVLPVCGIPGCADVQLSLKCENLQFGSAFKARGATNAVMSLSEQQASCGVVTHSSGNHAAALARAALQRGIAAHIVMPRNSAGVKLQAVRQLGIQPILCEPTAAAREAAAIEVQQRTGAVLIHPFNDVRVIAGQGTAALEILQQAPDVQDLIVPVGGGGLLAGTLLAVRALRPDVRVFGAEPAWADDARRSLQSGRIEPALRTDSIADGLRTPLGTLTFPIIRGLVNDILCADEQQIVAATGHLAAHGRLISEPSGAVPLAVLQQHADIFRGRRVVLLISGGNLDDASLIAPALTADVQSP